MISAEATNNALVGASVSVSLDLLMWFFFIGFDATAKEHPSVY